MRLTAHTALARNSGLLAALGPTNRSSSMGMGTNIITDIVEATAGGVWGVIVSVQMDRERANIFLNKRTWVDADALRADVRAAVAGKPTNYNIPFDAIGTSF